MLPLIVTVIQKQKQANAANGSKSANHEPGARPVDLSEISHLFPERSATWLTAASTSNLLPLHQSHCYPNNQSKKLKKFHFLKVSPGDQTADQGAWGLWVRDWPLCAIIHEPIVKSSSGFPLLNQSRAANCHTWLVPCCHNKESLFILLWRRWFEFRCRSSMYYRLF